MVTLKYVKLIELKTMRKGLALYNVKKIKDGKNSTLKVLDTNDKQNFIAEPIWGSAPRSKSNIINGTIAESMGLTEGMYYMTATEKEVTDEGYINFEWSLMQIPVTAQDMLSLVSKGEPVMQMLTNAEIEEQKAIAANADPIPEIN